MKPGIFKYAPLMLIAALEQIKSGGLPHTKANAGSIQDVLGIMFGIAGALALLMITYAGVNYITSDGDPQKTSKAKYAIIVALVGLAIAIIGESLVVFVIKGVS